MSSTVFHRGPVCSLQRRQWVRYGFARIYDRQYTLEAQLRAGGREVVWTLSGDCVRVDRVTVEQVDFCKLSERLLTSIAGLCAGLCRALG